MFQSPNMAVTFLPSIVPKTRPLLDPYFLFKSSKQPGSLEKSIPCNRDCEDDRKDGFYVVTEQWWANFQGKIMPGDSCSATLVVTTVAVSYMRALRATKRPRTLSVAKCFPHCTTRRSPVQRSVIDTNCITHYAKWMISHQTEPGLTCLHPALPQLTTRN
jgi:hypothetical protein